MNGAIYVHGKLSSTCTSSTT